MDLVCEISDILCESPVQKPGTYLECDHTNESETSQKTNLKIALRNGGPFLGEIIYSLLNLVRDLQHFFSGQLESIVTDVIIMGTFGWQAFLSVDQLKAAKLVINKRYDNEAENQEEKTGGETVVYNCEYYKSAEDTGGDFRLEWSIDGRPITDKNQRSRINILETSRSSVRQLKLTIKNVNSETDSGLYECKAIYANSGQPELSRKIRLSAMKPPKWIDESTKVAEKLGTSVTINCEAIGDPVPDVVISLSNGMPLPAPDRYIKDGDKVLINELKIEDKGVSIMCTASQILEKFDTLPTVTKFIDIDVYFKPELEGGESITRYGIIDQNVTVPCHSTTSNPLVEKFEFHDSVAGAMSHDDYSVDLAAQKALLQMHHRFHQRQI
uniref:Ig-like domain-containing protein n=1 Tax=Romanomermis culicivorax TaxID=13658 RepID=A0A915IWQ5_ROMCU